MPALTHCSRCGYEAHTIDHVVDGFCPRCDRPVAKSTPWPPPEGDDE